MATLLARDASNGTVEMASSVQRNAPAIPTVTMLAPAFPNPFSGATTIAFSLSRGGPVSIDVFGIDGRRVRSLASGRWEPGVYRLDWDGRDDAGHVTAAGVYFVHMSTPAGRFTKRITNLR
jgi:serine protease AprX